MAWFLCNVGNGRGGGDGADLIVTCSPDFSGSTITCTDGTKTFTQTCPSTSPYIVTFESIPTGTWTISGIYSGQTFTTTITITDFDATLNTIPNGATVTPTDDIQTWLNCANIWDKAYTTISQVLNDGTTVTALIASTNAVDYMARSTTWASSVCANSSAMTKIGANNYCSNKLLANSSWSTAICNSTYFKSVLNTKVPTMTSNTTPSGTASATDHYSTNDAYLAFDNNASTSWLSASTSATSTDKSLMYDFGSQVLIKKAVISPLYDVNGAHVKDYSIDGYDGSSWTSLASGTCPDADTDTTVIIPNNTTKYSKFRLRVTSFYNGNYVCVKQMQFYGRA